MPKMDMTETIVSPEKRAETEHVSGVRQHICWDGDCHDPGKKKKRKRKSRPGPTRQPLPPPPSVFLRAPRHASPAAGVHPREPCHVPAILASRAAASLFSSPLSLSASRPAPVPPQTLALSTIVAANELRFITSGEPPFDFSRGEHLLPPCDRFRPSNPLLPRRAGTPAEPRRHHRWTPSRRLSAGAPRPRRRQ